MARTTTGWVIVGLVGLAALGLSVLGGSFGSRSSQALASKDAAPKPIEIGASLDDLDSSLKLSASAAEVGQRDEIIGEVGLSGEDRATVEIEVLGRAGPAAGALIFLAQRFDARTPNDDAENQANTAKREFIADSEGKVTLVVAPAVQDTLHFTWPGSQWHQQLTWMSPRRGKSDKLKVRFPLGSSDMPIHARSYPSGLAIEGASVAVGAASTYTIPRTGKTIQTDRLGVAHVPALSGPTRDPYKITVLAEGHASASFMQTDEETNEPTSMWLIKNAKLSGRVGLTPGESSAEAAPNATVHLAPRSALREVSSEHEAVSAIPDEVLEAMSDGRRRTTLRMLGQNSKTEPSGVAVTKGQARGSARVDFEGRWTLDKIQFSTQEERLNDYVLVLVCQGHGRVLAENLVIGPGDELVIEDTALKGPPLEVHFTLADGSAAASAGLVLLTAESPTGGSVVRARGSIDELGRLSLPSLAPGNWRWKVMAPALAGEVTGILTHESRNPSVKSFQLAGHASLEGRVVGDLVHPATILWRFTGGNGFAYQRISSRADGRFRLPLLPANRSIDLVAFKNRPLFSDGGMVEAPDWGADVVTLHVGPKGVKGVVLTLSEPPSEEEASVEYQKRLQEVPEQRTRR